MCTRPGVNWAANPLCPSDEEETGAEGAREGASPYYHQFDGVPVQTPIIMGQYGPYAEWRLTNNPDEEDAHTEDGFSRQGANVALPPSDDNVSTDHHLSGHGGGRRRSMSNPERLAIIAQTAAKYDYGSSDDGARASAAAAAGGGEGGGCGGGGDIPFYSTVTDRGSRSAAEARHASASASAGYSCLKRPPAALPTAPSSAAPTGVVPGNLKARPSLSAPVPQAGSATPPVVVQVPAAARGAATRIIAKPIAAPQARDGRSAHKGRSAALLAEPDRPRRSHSHSPTHRRKEMLPRKPPSPPSKSVSPALRMEALDYRDERDSTLPQSRQLNMAHMGHTWFHGRIRRQEAERLLTRHGLVDGLFLVRNTSLGVSTFAVSICYGGKVYHNTVETSPEGELVYIASGRHFKSLVALVFHYSTSSGSQKLALRMFCPRASPTQVA